MSWIAAGHPLGEIGDKLACSERTIKNILHDAASRLGMHGRIELVAYACDIGAI